MHLTRTTCLLALLAAASAAPAQNAPEGAIAQFYTYRVKDRAAMEAGYRAHLRWHASRQDTLVWYAWTIESGPRRGLFMDGTAGAHLGELDTRPDLPGDAADFALNAAVHMEAMDIETWELLPSVSTARPLETRHPSATIDAFLLRVSPADAGPFEQQLGRLARGPRRADIRLGWYRKLRGGEAPAYLLTLARDGWAEVDAAGGTLSAMLARAYGAPPAESQALMARIGSIVTETWGYLPRLSLIPGRALAD